MTVDRNIDDNYCFVKLAILAFPVVCDIDLIVKPEIFCARSTTLLPWMPEATRLFSKHEVTLRQNRDRQVTSGSQGNTLLSLNRELAILELRRELGEFQILTNW